jgi:hypothetical protein
MLKKESYKKYNNYKNKRPRWSRSRGTKNKIRIKMANKIYNKSSKNKSKIKMKMN